MPPSIKQLTESLILTTAPFVIINTDNQGIIHYINPAVKSVFGYLEGEVENQNLLMLIPGLASAQYDYYNDVQNRGDLEIFDQQQPEHNVHLESSYLERFIQGRVNHGKKSEFQTTTKNNIPLWIDITVNKENINDDTNYFIIIHNITEQKQRQIEIEKLNEQLEDKVKQRTLQLEETMSSLQIAKADAESANKLKSLFLANMSHEIRTPLTAIIGFSETLQENCTDNEKNKLAKIVNRNGKHLLTLINDLLDMSKIEANRLLIEMLVCSPIQLISDIKAIMNIQIAEKQLYLNIEPILPFPKQIISDPTRLKQILLNLCSNAIKFTQSGGITIQIQYDFINNMMQIAVTDTGIGMTQEQTNRLFKPFTQADISTTRQYGGTGLGLYISMRLAKLLKGNIELSSTPGKGSCFTVNLKADIPNNTAFFTDISEIKNSIDEGIEQKPVITTLLNGKILVAEDNPDNQQLLQYLLQGQNIQLTLVENGLLATESAFNDQFDLILMDMQMPVMDGIEATKRLRTLGYKKPIIALTANVMTQDIQAYRSIGCNDHIGKPIDKQTLLYALSNHLPSINISTPKEDKKNDTKKDDGWQQLVDLYIKRLEKVPEIYNAYIAQRQWVTLKNEAHKIKGSALSYGFPEIGEIAQQIETEAETETGNSELLTKLVIKLNEYVSKALKNKA